MFRTKYTFFFLSLWRPVILNLIANIDLGELEQGFFWILAAQDVVILDFFLEF